MLNLRKSGLAALVVALALTLSACSILTPNKRPDDEKLRDGINLLMRDFSNNHPKLVNWKSDAVKRQISGKLPKGYATEAGWTLRWDQFVQGELPQVVIPWSILGQYPEKYALDINNYSGGKVVAQSIEVEIRHAQLQKDYYLAGIVHIRASTKDSNWVIFTSVPYLPFTDIAYGFAHRVNGIWNIDDFGTATVGCGRVPTAIQSEFGMSCPPAGN